MKSIYDCKTQFEYLTSRLDPRHSSRGIKAKISAFLLVQPAFLSQVLAKKFSLSLEQADLANQFFEHGSEESNFFILLVSRDRAGTTNLKKYYTNQIEQIYKKRLLASERLGKRAEVSELSKNEYYSSWVYSAIHVAATVQSLTTKQEIAQSLALPFGLVSKVLDFLLDTHLLIKNGDQFQWTDAWFRLEKNSPHIIKHHTNWRQRAIYNLEFQTDHDLHYSGLFSMDQKTAHKIKDQLMEAIKENLKLVENSPEEEIFVLNADFFSLLNKT